jgi:uncharacterized protein with GYD domain
LVGPTPRPNQPGRAEAQTEEVGLPMSVGDEMTIFITQARFTKEGLKGMISAPEDRAEVVGRLITAVGGKLNAYYLTSGDYDILLIFEAPSYEDVVPALIVAAAGSGVTDLKTVTALKSSEMKSTFAKAGSIALTYRSPGERTMGSPALATDAPNSDPRKEAKTDETKDAAKAATDILDARKKAVEDIAAGRPAPYYLAGCDDIDPEEA